MVKNKYAFCKTEQELLCTDCIFFAGFALLLIVCNVQLVLNPTMYVATRFLLNFASLLSVIFAFILGRSIQVTLSLFRGIQSVNSFIIHDEALDFYFKRLTGSSDVSEYLDQCNLPTRKGLERTGRTLAYLTRLTTEDDLADYISFVSDLVLASKDEYDYIEATYFYKLSLDGSFKIISIEPNI